MMKYTKVTKVMEMRDVHYTEKPRAIGRFLLEGFSIDNIVITRVSPNSYDLVAERVL